MYHLLTNGFDSIPSICYKNYNCIITINTFLYGLCGLNCYWSVLIMKKFVKYMK